MFLLSPLTRKQTFELAVCLTFATDSAGHFQSSLNFFSLTPPVTSQKTLRHLPAATYNTCTTTGGSSLEKNVHTGRKTDWEGSQQSTL